MGSGNWTIFDDFVLDDTVVMTGFSYADFFHRGGADDYLETSWSIWNSDPLLGGGPLYTGSAVAATSAFDLGSTLFSISGLNLALAPHTTYWLGASNIFSSPRSLTLRAGATGNGAIGFKQTDGEQFSFNVAGPDYTYFRDPEDTYFTVDGSVVPEPGSLSLLGIGIAALYARRRQRARSQHA